MGTGTLEMPAKGTDEASSGDDRVDDRVAAVVLKGTPEYRDWLTDLSDTTLIPVATIVRDALEKWAQARGLPAPPEGSNKRNRNRRTQPPATPEKSKPKRLGNKD
jgi:hypothetical protein